MTNAEDTAAAPGIEASLVGAAIAGRYQLVRLLGDGGMGAVYKAADLVLRRFVAIKLLHRHTTQKSPAAVDRFQREARAAAAIGHPNIIDILDFGLEGGRPYMVMEYLRGRSLSQILATEGSLAISRAASITAHTLAGLAAAHERGILHRDLKPANLMVVARFGDKNFVKVCDFGFAALMGPSSAEDGKTLTPERTLVGTPAYCAPERLRGDDRRDPRTDLYSVGVVLYEMIAGRRPFEAPTFRELAKKVWHEPPPPIAAHRRNVPPRLEEVVLRTLAKDPERRFRTAGELAAALVPFGGRSVSLEPDVPSESFGFEVAEIKAREHRKRGTRPEIDNPPDLPREHSTEPSMEAPEAAGARAVDASTDRDTGQFRRRGQGIVAAAAAAGPGPPLADTVTSVVLCRGRLAIAILRFVARRFGERAVKDLLDGMTPAERKPFDAGMLDDAWFDGAALRALVEAIDQRLGSDDLHTVVECGRAAAEGSFDQMRAIQPPGPSPELLVAELPMILKGLLRGVEIVVRRVGRGYGRYEVFESGTPSLTTGVLLLGFVERSLQRFGAGDVEVNLASARALDDAQTIIDISWLG